jgi:hypothetical protein
MEKDYFRSSSPAADVSERPREEPTRKGDSVQRFRPGLGARVCPGTDRCEITMRAN